MNRYLSLPLCTLLLLLCFGCGHQKPSAPAGRTPNASSPTRMMASLVSSERIAAGSGEPQKKEEQALSAETKIIKTAQLEFQVNDIQKSKQRISQLVGAEGGYIASLEESNDRERIQASFTIRVPASGFDSLVENILKEGMYVSNSKIERKDLTEEFLDLKARMEEPDFHIRPGDRDHDQAGGCQDEQQITPLCRDGQSAF